MLEAVCGKFAAGSPNRWDKIKEATKSERSLKQIQKKVHELTKNKQATAEERKRKETQKKQITEMKAVLQAEQTRQIEKGKKQPAETSAETKQAT